MTLQNEDYEEDEDINWPDGDSMDDDPAPESFDQVEPESSELPEPPPEAEPSTEPEPDQQASIPDQGDDLDKLRQKVKSAEGRFDKFSEDIKAMRRELSEREGIEEPEQEDLPDTPVLPEGWTETDWEDYATDSPTEAELLQANAREQSRLRQRLDSYEQQQAQEQSLKVFRQRIMDAHPDYESLMQSEGEQVRTFIAGQSNPLVKRAYEQVYQQGTADEVVELVNQYKLSKGSSGTLDRRVRQSLAVPSRSSVPDTNRRGGLPDENDEDAAWDYFDDDDV